jgi:hypothetical protein
MKASAVLLISLSLLATALSVTVTYYTDADCKVQAASTFQGQPNPLVAPLNKCTPSVSGSGVTPLWTKPTACSSTTTKYQVWSDSQCTTSFPTTFDRNVGTCLKDPKILPPTINSMMITCSSAATASVAALVAVASVVSLCV